MARRLGTRITESARLVGCSRSAVVDIHEKWIIDDDTSSRRQGVGRPRVINEKLRQRLVPGSIETGPWMSLRELPVRMNPDFSFIMSMAVSGNAICQANSFSPLVHQVIHRHGGGGIMLWGTFSWTALGPVVMVEQTMKAANYLNVIADQLQIYMAFVSQTGNGIFQQDNAYVTRLELCWSCSRSILMNST
ncbi:hypothetical protein AVEN_95504-1 [Araneus ventricosus]|uniref:Uncharacterized protein n=1 Tax=Araneus ventricosus TaxID=182803 RepID=A0A4Y2PER6_ARAVE|nr:hypothetical protein AVEN_95504-1 [Araneus ventricosus]